MLSGCSCERSVGVNQAPTNNKDIRVTKLFTHEGCSVYRFHDMEYVYYADCRGSVQYNTRRQSGKTTVTDKHLVKTNN